jgi:hypothetical protein
MQDLCGGDLVADVDHLHVNKIHLVGEFFYSFKKRYTI